MEDKIYLIKQVWKIALIAILILGAGFSGCLYAVPHYKVWSAKMTGEAELARATQNRQIIVQQAQAEKEAEITHAEGTAAANKIIGASLENNTAYIQWMWINRLEGQNNKTFIYVPTSGLIPNLEAGRIGTFKTQEVNK